MKQNRIISSGFICDPLTLIRVKVSGFLTFWGFSEKSESKLFQDIKGEDIITTSKIKIDIRCVLMPDFEAEKMRAYLKSLQLNINNHIFPIMKSYLHHEIRRGCTASGVKRIRIHGIRHSHISLLIDMGFSAVAIADRVGHESIDIT